MRPSSTRRPGSFAKMGIKVGKPSVDLAGACMKYKEQNVDSNVKGVAFLFKKNKIETFHGAGRIAAPGKVEVKAADGKTQMLETKNIVIATGSDVARLQRHRHRREAHRVVDRRAGARQGAAEAAGRRRRHHRARTRLGVAAARRRGRRSSNFSITSCRASTARSRKQFHRMLQKQGLTFKLSSKVTAVDTSGKTAQGEGRAGRRRRCGNASRPTSCWWRSAACPTPTASVSKRSASRRTIAAASSSIAHYAPMSPASMPSATSSPGRCWRTRPRMKASRLPKSSPARPAT